jgi:hypothetical protein
VAGDLVEVVEMIEVNGCHGSPSPGAGAIRVEGMISYTKAIVELNILYFTYTRVGTMMLVKPVPWEGHAATVRKDLVFKR